MKTGNCFAQEVDTLDLVIAEVTLSNLTCGRIYVVKGKTNTDMIKIKNNKGEEVFYSTEHFRFYEGETVNN